MNNASGHLCGVNRVGALHDSSKEPRVSQLGTKTEPVGASSVAGGDAIADARSKAVRALKACGLACCLAVCAGCSENPEVLQSSRILSPDEMWEVTLEYVENGVGFGLGSAFQEVHVHDPNATTAHHGDRDDSVVFYVKAEHGVRDGLVVEWIDSRRLRIKHPKSNLPGKALRRFRDIEIEYAVSTPSPGCTEYLL